MNKLIIIGRLGRDPEHRTTTSGLSVCEFSVAVKRKGDEADWFRVEVFGKTADYCNSYLKKGRLVAVEGRLESSRYTPKGGTSEVTSWKLIANNVVGLDRPTEQQTHDFPETGEPEPFDPFED